MSGYTLELRKIVESSNNVKVFDFDYNLFDNNLKPEFEKLFIDYFYFREIGQETIGRFKKELQTKLNTIYYYYKEYYKTVQQVEIEEFMVTKDATDTFTRTYYSEGTNEGQAMSEGNQIANSKNTDKVYDTPRNRVDILENVLSGASIGEGNSDVANKDKQESKTKTNNKITEETVLHSKGDLGVTSSGFLIDGWRNVITNIYQMIFDECEELFFGLF